MSQKTIMKLNKFRRKIISVKEKYNKILEELLKQELPLTYPRLIFDQNLKKVSSQVMKMKENEEISETSLKNVVNIFEDRIKPIRSNLRELALKIEQELYSLGIYRKFSFLSPSKAISFEKVMMYSDELDKFQVMVDNSIFDLNGSLEIHESEPDTKTIFSWQLDKVKEFINVINKKFSNFRVLFGISIILNFALFVLLIIFFSYQILINIYPESTTQVFIGFEIGIFAIILPISFAFLNKQVRFLRYFEINKDRESVDFIFDLTEKERK